VTLCTAVRPLRAFAVATLMAAAATGALAGLFDDEEARKAIVDLRTRISATDDSAKARAAELTNVEVVTFVPDVDRVMSKASAVIAMGGYNTFCEILAADKPALIVPRTVPRLEQYIRAERMSKLGLVGMLVDDDNRSIDAMAAAIEALPDQPPPSAAKLAGYLAGFETINHIVDGWFGAPVRTYGAQMR